MKPPEKVGHAGPSENSAAVAVVRECVPKLENSDLCVFLGLADIRDHMFELLAAYLHSFYSHCLWEVEVSPQNNLFEKRPLESLSWCVAVCSAACSLFLRDFFQNKGLI